MSKFTTQNSYVILCSEVVYLNPALSIICFACSSVLLYMNMITHSRCAFMFGLIVILFQVSQPMMMIMLEVERFRFSHGNILIDVTSGHMTFISHVIIS